MTARGSESRCNNMGGGGEHEGGQIQQPQVTWDHRRAGIPRLSLPNHPWIVIGTSCPVSQCWSILATLMITHPDLRATHQFVVPPATVEVDRAVCSMLQHRPAAASGLHITEHLWKSKERRVTFLVCWPPGSTVRAAYYDPCWRLLCLLNVSLTQCMYVVL